MENVKEPKAMSPETEEKDGLNDWHRALILLIVLFAFCIMLYYFGALHMPPELKWYESHSDGFLLLISIIAVIGAVWAILARVDAENAFKEAQKANFAAQEASRKATDAVGQATKAAEEALNASKESRKTYNSFGDSFEFELIFSENKLTSFLPKINDPKVKKLTFFLGFPCVGVFYDGPTFRDKSFAFFEKLIEELKLFKLNEDSQDKEIMIAYLEEEQTNKYIDESVSRAKLDDSFSGKLKAKIEEFKKIAEDTEKIKYFCFNEDPNYRFVISETKESSDSIMWVVSNFEKNAAEKFKSAGFMSTDANFFHTLEILYDNLKKKNDAA